jgi:hypothetical protein
MILTSEKKYISLCQDGNTRSRSTDSKKAMQKWSSLSFEADENSKINMTPKPDESIF